MRILLSLILSAVAFNKYLWATAIILPRPLAPFGAVFTFLNNILRGRNRSSKLLSEKSEEQIRVENLQENLRDLSIAYDILRDQLGNVKKLSMTQKTDLQRAKRENDLIKV
jgi:hypothetical protein